MMISILRSLLTTFVLLLVLIAGHNVLPSSSGGNGRAICDFATNQFFIGCQDEIINSSNSGGGGGSGAYFDPCGQNGIYCDERSHVVGIHIYDTSISQMESIPQSIIDEYTELLWLRIDVPVRSIYNNDDPKQYINRNNWIKNLCILDIDSGAKSFHECHYHDHIMLPTNAATAFVTSSRHCSYSSLQSARCSSSLIEHYFKSKYITSPIYNPQLLAQDTTTASRLHLDSLQPPTASPTRAPTYSPSPDPSGNGII